MVTEETMARKHGPGAEGPPVAMGLSEVVELVGHETRTDILLALASQQRETPRDPSLRFADLRRAVGHDDPGNFNYHLQRLEGTLVTRVPDGYRLSNVGQRFVGALLSGRYVPAADLEVGDHEAVCPVCGMDATAGHQDGSVRLDCPAGHSFVTNVAPEVLAERGIDETLRVAMHRTRYETQSIRQGVCPLCDGSMTGKLVHHTDREPSVACTATCERCGLFVQTTPGVLVLDHPAVVSLCYAHGLDVRDDAWNVLTEHVGDAEVVGEEPLRVATEVVVGDDSVTLYLEEGGSVTRVE